MGKKAPGFCRARITLRLPLPESPGELAKMQIPGRFQRSNELGSLGDGTQESAVKKSFLFEIIPLLLKYCKGLIYILFFFIYILYPDFCHICAIISLFPYINMHIGFFFWIIWEVANVMPLKNKEILLRNYTRVIKFGILSMMQYYYRSHIP